MSIQLTSRTKKILDRAKHEMKQLNHQCLQPEHLLLSFMQEKSGAFNEIFINITTELNTLRSTITHHCITCTYLKDILDYPINNDLKDIFKLAERYMEHYNQTYLNEGHLLKALLKSNTIDSLITKEEKNMFMKLGTTPRDMIVHLGNYDFPNLSYHVVRVNISLEDNLVSFIENNFSNEWASTVKNGLNKKCPNIFVAIDEHSNILGFSVFDTYKDRKGYFGPMGVKKDIRSKGVGHSLLHHCLNEMKQIGYEYIIIGGAGPIEFYEKACGAKVVPSFEEI